MGQTCKLAPIGTKKRIPLWPESPPPPYHPDPCHTQSASQSNTNALKLSLSVSNTPHHPHLHTLSASLPRIHTHTQTHTETWRVPCLTPGPRRSLVWRPVCVCLASNGPFKCRIFTADRAILRGQRTRRPEYASAPLSWRKLSLLSSHNATLTGNELVCPALGCLSLLFMYCGERSSNGFFSSYSSNDVMYFINIIHTFLDASTILYIIHSAFVSDSTYSTHKNVHTRTVLFFTT